MVCHFAVHVHTIFAQINGQRKSNVLLRLDFCSHVIIVDVVIYSKTQKNLFYKDMHSFGFYWRAWVLLPSINVWMNVVDFS